MKLKRLLALVLCGVMSTSMVLQSGAAGIGYLPDVTAQMSDGAYWSQDDTVQMSWEEIEQLNALNLAAKGTNMNDLKNHAETVDTVALNKALKKSTTADMEYYLGWTYLGKKNLAKRSDFQFMIGNTQNSHPSTRQKVLYAVAVQRSALRAFPAYTPIWDDPKDPDFDYQYLVSVRVNEPLVITSQSRDGKFYLAKSSCCSGWIPVEDVAVCRDKQQWLEAWDLAPEQTLVVYGDKVYTEMSNFAPQTSELMLTMGTALELADVEDPRVLIDNRAAYQSYAVWMPVRDKDGKYDKKLTLIPESAEVSQGYLPLTCANVMMVAMQALGSTYGWGGSLNAEDCSAYVRNIYKCFGLELARNTTWQSAMPVAKVDMNGMCREERIAVMNALPAGAVLFFSGHEMLYLGQENGKYYVVSSVSKIRDPYGKPVNQRIRGVVINTLDITRANGLSWLDALTCANVPYWGMLEGKSHDMPAQAWYHDGVRYMRSKGYMTADENGLFHPEEKVTQAQLVQILWAMSGKPAVDGVGKENWYTQAAAWIESRGLLPMAGESGFAPDSVVSREQLSVMLYQIAKNRGAGLKEEWGFVLDYADADKLSDATREAMSWLVKMNVISGTDGNRLDPHGDVSRAQLAVMLKRFLALTDPEAAK